MARRHLSLLPVAVIAAGCVAPAAQMSQSASPTLAAPTPAASARATSSAAPTPSPTPEPTATPAPTPAIEAPDGILPPESRAVVLVEALHLRAGDGIAEDVVATLSAGTLVVLDWRGPVEEDGLTWYYVSAGDQGGFAAAGSGGDHYLELASPRCTEPDPDLTALVSITAWEQLACYGDRSLTLVGTYGCAVCGSYLPGTYEPGWLAYPGQLSYLSNSQGSLVLHIPPESGLGQIPNAAIVRATGHFDDPAAATCVFTPPDEPSAVPPDPANAVLYCRERFVVDSYEVIGSDPDFEYPPAP